MKKVKNILLLLPVFFTSVKGDLSDPNSSNNVSGAVCSPLTPFLQTILHSSRRQKRSTLSLPNPSSLAISSRLTLPSPRGLNVIWIKVNLFLRPMFRDPISLCLWICLFLSLLGFSLGVQVPVRRLHSRQRRFASPGAIWDILLGFNILWPNANLMFDIILRNELDMLFGDSNALKKQIRGQDYRRYKRDTKNSSGININLFGRRKRNVEKDNFLIKSLEEDQVSILGKIEEAITKLGLNGRQCILRTVCELKETPIHDWSLIGEMLSLLFRPKEGYHSELFDYKEAEKLGSDSGDCWSHFPECPVSIFNVIPDLYTKEDVIDIDFEGGLNSEP